MKYLVSSIVFIFGLSVYAAPKDFKFSELTQLPADFTLVCGIKHADYSTHQLLIYIKNGKLIDHRGNVEFYESDNGSGVGLLKNGDLGGFSGNGKFILSPKEGLDKIYVGTPSHDGKIYGTQALDGCATSIEDYYAGKFISSFAL